MDPVSSVVRKKASKKDCAFEKSSAPERAAAKNHHVRGQAVGVFLDIGVVLCSLFGCPLRWLWRSSNCEESFSKRWVARTFWCTIIRSYHFECLNFARLKADRLREQDVNIKLLFLNITRLVNIFKKNWLLKWYNLIFWILCYRCVRFEENG